MIQRYEFDYLEDAPHDSGMTKDNKGEWCKYKDIENLIQENEKMKECLKWYRDKKHIMQNVGMADWEHMQNNIGYVSVEDGQKARDCFDKE